MIVGLMDRVATLEAELRLHIVPAKFKKAAFDDILETAGASDTESTGTTTAPDSEDEFAPPASEEPRRGSE